MGKRDAFWNAVPCDDDGQYRLPQDPTEREALIRSAFGAEIIAAVESVLRERLKVVRGERPHPGTDDYEAELARREVFAELSEGQRREVEEVVKRACFATLYWILVKLEHFSLGEVDFTVTPYTSADQAIPQINVEQTELHHLYFDWVESFSEYGDQ